MITEFSYHFRKLDVEDKPKKSKVPKTLKLINVKTQCLNDQLNKDTTEVRLMENCHHLLSIQSTNLIHKSQL